MVQYQTFFVHAFMAHLPGQQLRSNLSDVTWAVGTLTANLPTSAQLCLDVNDNNAQLLQLLGDPHNSSDSGWCTVHQSVRGLVDS